jgi:hypothetical protein
MRKVAFSDVPRRMKAPLKENLRNLISGMSSMLKMLKGFYQKVFAIFVDYILIAARVEQVYLLYQGRGHLPLTRWLARILNKGTRQDVARVVEACSATLGNAYEALLLLVLPHARGPILAAAHEGTRQRVQIQLRDLVRMPQERAQNVVVVQ